jgi:hypothetical protein
MTRPDWLTAALAKHAPKAERDKQRPARAALQAALRSDKRADRDAAKAEVAAKVEQARTRPAPAKKR